MPSAQERGISVATLSERIISSPQKPETKTLYLKNGSYSWSGDSEKLEEDRKSLGCKMCDQVLAQPKIIFLNEARTGKIVFSKQEEAQAAELIIFPSSAS